jgi:hypothetical protein
MSEQILRRIRKTKYPFITDFLWHLCEFELLDEDPPGWFALQPAEPYRIIARDGAGGRFCLYSATAGLPHRLLYVSSEGQAGTIANSLAEGMQMMVALPYWRDCLKFSGGGDLQEMRKAQIYFEAKLRQRMGDIKVRRLAVYQELDVAAPSSPLESLRQAITEGTAVVVSTKDGTRFESLFSKFFVPDQSD